MEKKTHIIDAGGKTLGRLASQVAILLQGKQKVDFDPSRDMGDFVTIKNLKGIRITGRKMEQKRYFRHSGYLGGEKERTLAEMFREKPKEVFQKAVWGMLPKNRLRKRMTIRLKIEL